MCYSRTVIIVIPLVTSLAILLSIIFFLSQGSCPEGHFECSSTKKCIKQRNICDGHSDCPLGEDEEPLYCADLHGGFWRLVDSLSYLPPNDTCDSSKKGIETGGVDSVFAAYHSPAWSSVLREVPEECTCTEYSVVSCSGQFLNHLPMNISKSATKLILARNNITLRTNTFAEYSLELMTTVQTDVCNLPLFNLVKLPHLADNNISELPQNIFHGQAKLEKLFLQNNNLQAIPANVFDGIRNLKWLFLNNNKVKTIHFDGWTLNNLTWLDLSRNQLSFQDQKFPILESLTFLYLDENCIVKLTESTFSNLHSLQDLSLGLNQIKEIHPLAFKNNPKLQELNLRNNKLIHLSEVLFVHVGELEKLNLGGNVLLVLGQSLLSPLKSLKSLDLQDIDINNINQAMFSHLKNLDFVYFKRFYFCTYVLHVPKCSPISDGTSSVSDLLGSNFLRVTLWLVALFTLVTNGLVLWHRLSSPTYASPLNSLITSLACSDFLMGIYLVLIGCQDIRFKGHYMMHARVWMSSWLCTLAGVLVTLSSEVGMLMLVLISGERYLLIAAPLSRQQRLKPQLARLSVAAVWVFGLFISSLPVVGWRGAMRFYGTNGFCFPLHIDDPFLFGWQYSAGIYLGLNSVGVIGTALLYFGVFHSIYETRRATTLNVRDSEFALRFLIIVLTNFCCWIPIISLKILALLEVPFTGQLYGWLAVFVLPINSGVNPILYTFSIPNHRSAVRPGDQKGNASSMKHRISKVMSLTHKPVAFYEPPKTSQEQF